jgi:putative flavoprotein involved in K+ transport
MEASDRPAGSWPRYYDSLRLFSPAAYSSMPGMPFPGAPDRYPGRDEVADYLERYASWVGVEIQTSTRVLTIRQDGRHFIVVTEDGRALRASGIVAASGSFSNPYRPSLEGEEAFAGELAHVADYRNPAPYAGGRVIVVGAGDSAAQVANELAPIATVTLASRHPVRFIPQRLGGQDVHYWLRETGFDTLPAEWLRKITGGSGVTASASRSTRSSWPPDTDPAWGTCASWAPSSQTGLRSTSAGSPARMSAWCTSAWNTSARLPPTPCGA